MAFAAFPANARISRQSLSAWYPGKVEHVSQSGVRQTLYRGTGRWRGSVTIARPAGNSQEDARAMRSWLMRMAGGVDWTWLPLRDGGDRGNGVRTATFDTIPASSDYDPSTDPVTGTPASDQTTITALFGNAVILNRNHPGMDAGCLVTINRRLHMLATYSLAGDSPLLRDNVTASLWPAFSGVAQGDVVRQAFAVRAYLRAGADAPALPSQSAMDGPWTFLWDEAVTL